MRISVIMPAYLGGYSYKGGVHKSASNPEDKFVRAVNSFLGQTFKDAELIIVSDGCPIAERIYNEKFASYDNIRFIMIEKQETYNGIVRQRGIEIATGEIICYLDHDDCFGENHLEIISSNFDTAKYDWVYYNDYYIESADFTKKRMKDMSPKRNIMGTSSFAHRRDVPVLWGGDYTHDFDLVRDYLLHRPSMKIPTPEYYICHCTGLNIDF